MYDLPEWAQDHSYGGFSGAALPIRDDALDDFGRLGEFLAAHFSGRVRALECWNEPNLWTFLYPQRTADDAYFAPRLYLRMLKAFHAGVQRGDPDMVVVAGATAPLGPNDRNRTSPQRFARFLADHGAAAYFDVYSHHPYTPGGSLHILSPRLRPATPPPRSACRICRRCCASSPASPSTSPSTPTAHATPYMFGLTVTPTLQADYLRRAYAYVKRYKQVKLLMWYPDAGHGARNRTSAGVRRTTRALRKVDGDRKLSWFAFAGGNRITIDAPSRAPLGRVIRISGKLTNSSVGALSGRRLVLQSRRFGEQLVAHPRGRHDGPLRRLPHRREARRQPLLSRRLARREDQRGAFRHRFVACRSRRALGARAANCAQYFPA